MRGALEPAILQSAVSPQVLDQCIAHQSNEPTNQRTNEQASKRTCSKSGTIPIPVSDGQSQSAASSTHEIYTWRGSFTNPAETITVTVSVRAKANFTVLFSPSGHMPGRLSRLHAVAQVASPHPWEVSTKPAEELPIRNVQSRQYNRAKGNETAGKPASQIDRQQ